VYVLQFLFVTKNVINVTYPNPDFGLRVCLRNNPLVEPSSW